MKITSRFSNQSKGRSRWAFAPLVTAIWVAFCLIPGTGADAPPAGNFSAFRVHITGQGSPMILIPGLSSSGDTWKGTVAHFGDHYKCYVLTLAGFAGVPPIHGPFLSTVRGQLAAYIQANHLDKPIIVGHSLGGNVALDLAAHDPNLVGPVVIVDSLPFYAGAWFQVKTVAQAKPIIASMHTYMLNETREQYDEYVKSGAATKYMVTSPADLKTIEQWGLASDPATVTEAMYEMLNQDLRPELSKITAPVLVLGTWAGLRDEMKLRNIDLTKSDVIKTFQEQYVGLPHLHFVLSGTSRHFIMFDDPQWFYAQLGQFLGNPQHSL